MESVRCIRLSKLYGTGSRDLQGDPEVGYLENLKLTSSELEAYFMIPTTWNNPGDIESYHLNV